MSRLEELIQELCPDGVEYKALGEIAAIKNGRDYKHLGNGEIPVYGSGGIMTYVDTPSFTKKSVLIPRKGSLSNLFYVEKPFWNVDTIFYTDIQEEKVIPKYLYYCLSKKHLEDLNQAGGVPSLTQKVLNKVLIPVPPLPVQEEVVRILDTFTELTAELTAGLTAELTARKKQYEYYLNGFLDFSDISAHPLSEQLSDQHIDHVSKVRLGDIGHIAMCKRVLKKDTSETGDIPFFKIGTFGNEPTAFISSDLFAKLKSNYSYPKVGDVLISAAGTIGRTIVFDGQPAYFQDSNIVWLEHDESLALNRYLYYCYKLSPWKISEGGTIARLYNSNIAAAEIYLPSLEIQSVIVNELDNFSKLSFSLEEGLPAEIAARQKQYEYYRDKLLNFKELKSEGVDDN